MVKRADGVQRWDDFVSSSSKTVRPWPPSSFPPRQAPGTAPPRPCPHPRCFLAERRWSEPRRSLPPPLLLAEPAHRPLRTPRYLKRIGKTWRRARQAQRERGEGSDEERRPAREEGSTPVPCRRAHDFRPLVSCFIFSGASYCVGCSVVSDLGRTALKSRGVGRLVVKREVGGKGDAGGKDRRRSWKMA